MSVNFGHHCDRVEVASDSMVDVGQSPTGRQIAS